MLKIPLNETNDSPCRIEAINNEIKYHEKVVQILTKLKDKKQNKINNFRTCHYHMMMFGDNNTEEYIVSRTKMDLLIQNLEEINRQISVENSYTEKNKYYLSNVKSHS